jgi:hypothetical protein
MTGSAGGRGGVSGLAPFSLPELVKRSVHSRTCLSPKDAFCGCSGMSILRQKSELLSECLLSLLPLPG